MIASSYYVFWSEQKMVMITSTMPLSNSSHCNCQNSTVFSTFQETRLLCKLSSAAETNFQILTAVHDHERTKQETNSNWFSSLIIVSPPFISSQRSIYTESKMAYKRKSWQEKLEDKKNLPKILKLEKNFPCYNALHKMGVNVGERIVIANPSDVVGVMRKIPKRKLVTINEICSIIAKKHRVKGCCSLTTGIFIMTAANAAEEARKGEGKKNKNLNIPYWRTLKSDGALNEKYPGGVEAHKKLLEKEGFEITEKGKKFQVRDFEKYLVRESELSE